MPHLPSHPEGQTSSHPDSQKAGNLEGKMSMGAQRGVRGCWGWVHSPFQISHKNYDVARNTPRRCWEKERVKWPCSFQRINVINKET